MFFNKQFQKKIPLLIFFTLFFSLCVSLPKPPLSLTKPIEIYANQCDDDLRKCFISAIKEAKRSVTLIVYSLNDPEIFKILKKKKKENIALNIVIDSKNKKDINEIKEMVTLKEKKSSLMHQKILIVDEKKVWIGSANFTSSSLQMHDNLIVGLYSPEIAQSIIASKGGNFHLGTQKIELFFLPKEKKESYSRVQSLLKDAKQSLEIAMFTWTHPELTQSVIEASLRGLNVNIVLDENSSIGTSKKSKEKLMHEKVNTKVNIGSPLLHHKCCYIDKEILILGSANWTKAAFSKNDECILIIHDLKKDQKKKMEKLWHALRATSI